MRNSTVSQKILIIMFKRLFLISVSFLLFSISSYGQFLHFGVKTFMTPKIYMAFFDYDETDYVYYFSNENNETIRFSGLEESETKSRKGSTRTAIRPNSGQPRLKTARSISIAS